MTKDLRGKVKNSLTPRKTQPHTHFTQVCVCSLCALYCVCMWTGAILMGQWAMPHTQRQQDDSRGQCSSYLLPFTLLLLSIAALPSQAAIHIPANCEYRFILHHSWQWYVSMRFKDLFVVLITLLIHQSTLISSPNHLSSWLISANEHNEPVSPPATSIIRVRFRYYAPNTTLYEFSLVNTHLGLWCV